MGDLAALVTAATGAAVGGWTLYLTAQRRRDDTAAALVDDLAERSAALRRDVDACETRLRVTADYCLALRRALLDAGITPPPWPPDLDGR